MNSQADKQTHTRKMNKKLALCLGTTDLLLDYQLALEISPFRRDFVSFAVTTPLLRWFLSMPLS